MAVTTEELRALVTHYYTSTKIPHINKWKVKLFNFEPFSIKKTQTTLFDCFAKLLCNTKSTHNRKYLKSFFPYYVFYENIYDLDGNVVLLLCRKKGGTGYYTKTVIHVTREFYNTYSEHVDRFYVSIGGRSEGRDPNYTPELVIHEEVTDIYALFHKVYEFESIKDIKGFKEELLGAFTKELFNIKNKEELPFSVA
jgi:hypothetical protein